MNVVKKDTLEILDKDKIIFTLENIKTKKGKLLFKEYVNACALDLDKDYEAIPRINMMVCLLELLRTEENLDTIYQRFCDLTANKKKYRNIKTITVGYASFIDKAKGSEFETYYFLHKPIYNPNEKAKQKLFKVS